MLSSMAAVELGIHGSPPRLGVFLYVLTSFRTAASLHLGLDVCKTSRYILPQLLAGAKSGHHGHSEVPSLGWQWRPGSYSKIRSGLLHDRRERLAGEAAQINHLVFQAGGDGRGSSGLSQLWPGHLLQDC